MCYFSNLFIYMKILMNKKRYKKKKKKKKYYKVLKIKVQYIIVQN